MGIDSSKSDNVPTLRGVEAETAWVATFRAHYRKGVVTRVACELYYTSTLAPYGESDY